MQCAASKIYFHLLISKPPQFSPLLQPIAPKAPKTSKQLSWQGMTSRPLRDITKTPNIIEDIHTVFAQLFFPVTFPHLRLCKPQQCESLLQPMHPIKHLVLLFCTTRQLPESDHYCSIVSVTFFTTIFGELVTDIFMLCCVDRHFVASMLFFLYSTST